MAKSPITIMSADEERFMAFKGLLQWTYAVVCQAPRVKAAKKKLNSLSSLNLIERHLAILDSHVEDHYFIISANKLYEYREWSVSFGLFSSVDFGTIDGFSREIVKDLRNMREHIVDYFRGQGLAADRWVIATPEYKADASSVVGNMIGGRLDWVAFARAAETLLPQLLAEPIPYPRRS